MRKGFGLALAACLLISGCAVNSPAGGETSSTQGAGVQAGQSQPVASPVAVSWPTPDWTALVPGKNHNLLASEYAYPAKDVHNWLVKGAQSADYPSKKIAFLTFDDGPNNSTTPVVLDILKRHSVPATFFYIGGNVGVGSADPAVIKRTVEEGHSIAIHTFSHNYGLLYPGRKAKASAVLADREKALEAIRNVLGPDFDTAAYRYPGGHMSWRGMQAADGALAAKGVYWLDWNTLNGDAEPASRAPTSVAGAQAMVMNNLGEPPANVAVVLMHDTGGPNSLTVRALPGIIDQLTEAGYEFGVIA